MSRLRQLKAVGLTAATVKALADLINDYTAGKAAGGYAAGHVAEKTVVDQQYSFDGANHCAVLFYVE